MDKVAIFADWANVYQNIKRAAKELSVKGFDHNNICHLTYFFHSFISSDEKIFRIYFYNATAMSGQEVETYIGKAPRFDASTRANFNIYWRTEAVAGDPKSTPAYKQDLSHRQSEKLHQEIMRSNLYALRLGQQRCQNIDATGRPTFAQKQVDMMMGIDIAHVSFYRQVEKIMIFSADTDMVPALKVARVSGLQTVSATINKKRYPDIRIQKHCDYCRSLNLDDIYNKGKTDVWDTGKITRTEVDFK